MVSYVMVLHLVALPCLEVTLMKQEKWMTFCYIFLILNCIFLVLLLVMCLVILVSFRDSILKSFYYNPLNQVTVITYFSLSLILQLHVYKIYVKKDFDKDKV